MKSFFNKNETYGFDRKIVKSKYKFFLLKLYINKHIRMRVNMKEYLL